MKKLASILVLSTLAAYGCGRSETNPPGPNIPEPAADVTKVAALETSPPPDLPMRQTETQKGNLDQEHDLASGKKPMGGQGAEASVTFADNKPLDGDDRKLVRTGRVELVVPSYDAARAKIDALVARIGGYVDATSVDRRQDAVTDATITVRIPSTAIPGLMPALREIGDVIAESTSAEDVTDQYVDVSARLASDQVLEKRLLELAADKGGTIDQVLAVERELARVREEIESYQGQLRQWNDRIAMSTLTLSLTTRRPEIAAATAPTFGERARQTWDSSIRAFEEAATWLAVHGLASLPWLLLIIPALVLLRRLARRIRIRLPFVIARRAPEATPATTAPAAAAPDPR
jgi:hypothetical protein